eukprot:4889074-Pyramimonas_sp.AAC.1
MKTGTPPSASSRLVNEAASRAAHSLWGAAHDKEVSFQADKRMRQIVLASQALVSKHISMGVGPTHQLCLVERSTGGASSERECPPG